MKGWMKFMGIMNIIAGALNALSLVGILWAWIPIWVGVILVGAGSKADEFAQRGDAASLEAMTGKLKSYFTISGILMIVSMGLGLIAGIVWVILIVGGMIALPSLSDYLNT
jgi:hypothetical protein